MKTAKEQREREEHLKGLVVKRAMETMQGCVIVMVKTVLPLGGVIYLQLDVDALRMDQLRELVLSGMKVNRSCRSDVCYIE